VLTDQVADGVPTPRDVFTRGQGAVVWVRYELRSPGAQLVFVWFREGAAAGAAAEQLDQSVVDLDAAGDVVTADLPPTAMDLPGRYRVDVQLDGQTIATRTFAVATAGV
jgi:outer membrane usher protein FimD/PapC